MPGCCYSAYDGVFDAREARRSARRYRRKGLDESARRVVDFLARRGVRGMSVLEVGGGIGAVQIELLRAGAASAENVELSSGYEETARALVEEAGLLDRVQRRVLDLVEQPEAVEPADVVVMHRVICCYPDMDGLVTTAANHARRYLALTFPVDRWWIRLGIEAGNVFLWLTRSRFRAYLHSPRAIFDVAATHGFQRVHDHHGWIWETTVLERSQDGPTIGSHEATRVPAGAKA